MTQPSPSRPSAETSRSMSSEFASTPGIANTSGRRPTSCDWVSHSRTGPRRVVTSSGLKLSSATGGLPLRDAGS